MYTVIEEIRKKAGSLGKKILFFEVEDKRILKAAELLSKQGIHVILVGCCEKIKQNFKLFGIDLDDGIKIIEITDQLADELGTKLHKIRENKGLSLHDALQLIRQREYFSTMLVKEGYADCMIGGALTHTDQVLRPALQILREKGKIVSSFFLMAFADKNILFADCAMNIEPDADELAEIAINTAGCASMFGMNPKIAMLSFSTKGSSNCESAEKVREAAAIVRKKRPELVVDGELQADAAIVEDVAQIKCPSSPIKGDANVLIFPNLDAGNISYKLVQRLSGCRAIGPIMVGLEKPVNDLSRGCSVEDIVDVAMISVMQCGK